MVFQTKPKKPKHGMRQTIIKHKKTMFRQISSKHPVVEQTPPPPAAYRATLGFERSPLGTAHCNHGDGGSMAAAATD